MAKRKTSRQVADKRFVVRGAVANILLAKAGSAMTLQIFDKDEKLGELEIGRGSLFWCGSSRKKRKRIPWARFAEMLNHLAYGE